MCGIAGFKRFGETPITADNVRVMLLGIKSRGNHATGISIQKADGEIFTHKNGIPANQFILEKAFDDFLKLHLEDAQTVLLHARAATIGDPRYNDNNHPLDQGISSVVHNGVLQNDSKLFADMNLKRYGTVDSDILRAILDAHGITPKGIETLRKIHGTAAIAAVSNKFPGKLLLARSGNPIILASTPDMLVWASEKRFIHQSMRPFMRRFGLLFQPNTPAVAFSTMNDQSAHIIGPEGLEFHDRFYLQGDYTPHGYNLRELWKRRKGRWKVEDLPEYIVCPNRECSETNTIPSKWKGELVSNLRCAKCDTPLGSDEASPKGVLLA